MRKEKERRCSNEAKTGTYRLCSFAIQNIYEAPPQGREEVSEIAVLDKYERGPKDIEGFSHLHIFYHLHESGGYPLSVKTPWNSNLHGLFATRTPHRPNPIGYSVAQLIERKKCTLKVEGLDAIEGTPVLDIKPYIPEIDSKPNAKIGWLQNKLRLWSLPDRLF